MRWIFGVLVILAALAGWGYHLVQDYPYKTYQAWISGKDWNKYYSISNYRPLLLVPGSIEQIPEYQEDYVQLWRAFPIRNSLIPLPTRHPLFITIPILEYHGRDRPIDIGMSITSSSSRELSRVYTLPTSLYKDHSLGQELFKLPYFKNRVLNKNLDELWKDIFSFRIEPKKKSLDEMVYDLFILHLRSKLLPKETIGYGLIRDGKKAVIELSGANKDYKVELVLTMSSGSIYSYILRTEKLNQDSIKLRAKFLNDINFSPIDEAMARVLYTEFKQLNFSRQVDQEGMLYLFSAFTQNPDNVDLLKEMIFYLERGQNKPQLKVLYDYAFKRFGKTFTTMASAGGDESPEINLQRKIELEEKDRLLKVESTKNVVPAPPELTPDEKMNLYLKKAKENRKEKKKEDMTIH